MGYAPHRSHLYGMSRRATFTGFVLFCASADGTSSSCTFQSSSDDSDSSVDCRCFSEESVSLSVDDELGEGALRFLFLLLLVVEEDDEVATLEMVGWLVVCRSQQRVKPVAAGRQEG